MTKGEYTAATKRIKNLEWLCFGEPKTSDFYKWCQSEIAYLEDKISSALAEVDDIIEGAGR